jgi:predicted RNA methylase
MAQTESGWQLEGSAPELYERYMVPGIARLWVSDLVERAAPKPGERFLDVACGTGIVARLAAAAMGTGRVAGLDINEGMLAVARSATPLAGLVGAIDNAQRNALERSIECDISAALAGGSEGEVTSPQEVHVVRARK